MPHAWVGAEYIRSVMDCLAYDRESDSALVVGAGIPAAWVDSAPGVVARGLPTVHGPLDIAMRGDGRSVRVRLGGGLAVPPGGVVLASPYDRPIRAATVNGRRATIAPSGDIVIRRLPANVTLWY